jgi:hypothetical protein
MEGAARQDLAAMARVAKFWLGTPPEAVENARPKFGPPPAKYAA